MHEAEQIQALQQEIMALRSELADLKKIVLYGALIDQSETTSKGMSEASWRIRNFVEQNRKELADLTKV